MNNLLVPKTSVVAPQNLKKNTTTNSMYVVPMNYDEIRDNIQEFGLLTPLLITDDYEIISGNLRHQIALDLGLEGVPVVFIDIPEDKKAVIAVSTNKFRIKSIREIAAEVRFYEKYYKVGRGKRTDLNPQMKVVKDEKETAYKSIGLYTVIKVKSIEDKLIKLYGDDIEKINKEFSKIDKGEFTLNQLEKKLSSEVLIENNKKVVPEEYDFITDKVKIYNTSSEELIQLEDNSIQTVVTSPPYFDMRDYNNGENQLGMQETSSAFIQELLPFFDEAMRVLKNEGSLFVNINDKIENGEYQMVPEMFLIEMRKKGWIYVDKYLWLKPNSQYTGNKGSVRNFEPIFHFVKSKDYYFNQDWLKGIVDDNDDVSYGTTDVIKQSIKEKKPIDNIQVVKEANAPKLLSGLNFKDNIFRHKSANTQELRTKCMDTKQFHLTHSATFPLSLPSIFILSTSKPGDTILDNFSGTGTTGEAAVLLDRKYIGYELNPEYVLASEVRLSEYDLNAA